MKRFGIFIAIVLMLVCIVPIAASPPDTGQLVAVSSASNVEAVVASTINSLVLIPASFEAIASAGALESYISVLSIEPSSALICYQNYGKVPTLADLMYGVAFNTTANIAAERYVRLTLALDKNRSFQA